jgi:hypothetical protein
MQSLLEAVAVAVLLMAVAAVEVRVFKGGLLLQHQ